MGVGTAQDLGLQLTALDEIVGERRVALHQLDGVDLDLGFADHRHLRHVEAGDEAGHCVGCHRRRVGRVDVDGVHPVGHRCEDQRAERFWPLAPHHRSSPFDGLDRLHVCRFPIENAGQHVANFGLTRVGVGFEQHPRSQHGRRGRVPGLHGAGGHERRLNGVEVDPVEGLACHDLMPVGLGSQHAIGVDQPMVDENRRRAGLTGVGAVPHRDHALAAQHGEQCFVRAYGKLAGHTVQRHHDRQVGVRRAAHESSSITRVLSVAAR